MKNIITLLFVSLLFSTIYAQETATDFKNDGMWKHKVKNYAGALSSYNKSIELSEENPDPDTYYRAALCAYQNTEYELAVEYFDEVIKRKYKKAIPYKLKAKTYEKLEDFDNLKTTLKAGIESYPENSIDLKKMLGLAYFDRGEYDKAIVLLEDVYMSKPKDRKTNEALTTIYEDRGLTDEEIKLKFKELKVSSL